MRRAALAALLSLLACPPAIADERLFELAKKVANPIADLATAPLQYNWDGRIGEDRQGTSNYVRFEPIVPVHLDQDWSLISRLFMPMIEQSEVSPSSGTQDGLAGVNLSAFLSPRGPVQRGLSLGLGPVVDFPASSSALGSQRWSLGPTAAVVWQPPGPWTVGLLVRQLWSVGGSAEDAAINEIYLQPFLSYTTHDAWTLGVNSESTYYWTNNEGSVPINLTLTKLIRLGGAAVSFGPGVRYWVEDPDSDAHGWAARFEVDLVLPDD
jgi:Putative MetA-pathway of phenol degradation